MDIADRNAGFAVEPCRAAYHPTSGVAATHADSARRRTICANGKGRIMSTNVDMHVEQVDGTGLRVRGLVDDAQAVAQEFLANVTDAEDVVGHPRLGAALARYHGAWATPTHELVHRVEQLGAAISGAAHDVASSAVEAAELAHNVTTDSESLASRLNGRSLP